jgi:hypothetical protein
MILYRPVGTIELKLIEELGYKGFPPRLPEQPIFYPVLNEKYANEIAKRWNTKDKNSGYKGFVTKFEINDDYINNFEIHQVGDNYHLEYWIPAEELETFNNNIIGKIELINEFIGN